MNNRLELLEEFRNSIKGPVIVEGRKDFEALRALGVEDILQLNKTSLLDVVESLQGISRIAVLTDLDQEGKILRKKLLPLMSQYGIQEDKRPREILAKMRVSHVEGLKNLSLGATSKGFD